MAAFLLLYSVRRGRWRCFWFFPLWQHFAVLGRSIQAFPSQPAAAGLSWFLPSGNGWTGTWWQEIFQASDGQTIQLHSDIGQGCTWNKLKNPINCFIFKASSFFMCNRPGQNFWGKMCETPQWKLGKNVTAHQFWELLERFLPRQQGSKGPDIVAY